MNKQEFMEKVAEVTPKEKQIKEVPDREYSIIEKVYTFHPAISETEGKRQIAELYVNFGMVLIMDMVPRAELMAKKEEELREAQMALSKVREEIEGDQEGRGYLMAAAKIEAMWDMDGRDHPVLVLEKKRGKINLAEVEDLLRYSKSGEFQGNYVLLIRAGEATCGGSGWVDDLEEPKGDQWALYQVEAEEPCPVCGQLAPPFEWCPMCGESLTGKDLNAEQAMGNAEFLLESMKREALRMIESTDLQETRKAWYHSHLGALDFARQMGLITEERRQQLYKQFQREANNGKDR